MVLSDIKGCVHATLGCLSGEDSLSLTQEQQIMNGLVLINNTQISALEIKLSDRSA